jgi:hypothetical protein
MNYGIQSNLANKYISAMQPKQQPTGNSYGTLGMGYNPFSSMSGPGNGLGLMGMGYNPAVAMDSSSWGKR